MTRRRYELTDREWSILSPLLPNIPPKANRKGSFIFSRWVYRQRNLVERFFNRIKQF